MDNKLIQHVIKEINNMAEHEIKIMEVCGTHTQMISKLGIRSVLSPKIKLLSGPGCPVCVTHEEYIDRAIEILNNYDVTIATFGDLLRVKGTRSCLLDEKSKGKDVRIIHSPLDLIEMAEAHRDKKIIFLGVGFETTSPIIALAIKATFEKELNNLFFLTSLKLMSPILHYILKQPKNQIQGLICPGHVATIKGANYFKFIAHDYNIPAAICGFEALDILGGIHYLVKQITNNEKRSFENLYKRCVKPKGNAAANRLMQEVFQVSGGEWRGIGKVDNSFLTINKKYESLDGKKNFIVKTESQNHTTKCTCSDIILGNKTPTECPLFNRGCNPLNPHGPCMVSAEVAQGKLAFTTDSFVVKPLFFSGGDIGKLAICGTINDLVVSGATPHYLSCGFIIEEGFSMDLLEKIARTMGEMCKETGVKIITGDTKVVEKGSIDGLFINTSGIGVLDKGYEQKPIKAGDRVIVTGGIGEHGTTIAIERYKIKVKGDLKSDCMALNKVGEKLAMYANGIKLMKDPTRGGLATALNEVAEFAGMSIELREENIPIKKEVISVNQLIGLDPLYLACEGRMILVVDEKESKHILKAIRQCEGCQDAAIIGSIIHSGTGPIVLMETLIGGKRMVGSLEGAMLPRIC